MKLLPNVQQGYGHCTACHGVRWLVVLSPARDGDKVAYGLCRACSPTVDGFDVIPEDEISVRS